MRLPQLRLVTAADAPAGPIPRVILAKPPVALGTRAAERCSQTSHLRLGTLARLAAAARSCICAKARASANLNANGLPACRPEHASAIWPLSRRSLMNRLARIATAGAAPVQPLNRPYYGIQCRSSPLLLVSQMAKDLAMPRCAVRDSIEREIQLCCLISEFCEYPRIPEHRFHAVAKLQTLQEALAVRY